MFDYWPTLILLWILKNRWNRLFFLLVINFIILENLHFVYLNLLNGFWPLIPKLDLVWIIKRSCCNFCIQGISIWLQTGFLKFWLWKINIFLWGIYKLIFEDALNQDIYFLFFFFLKNMGFEKHVFTSYSFGTKLEMWLQNFPPQKNKMMQIS